MSEQKQQPIKFIEKTEDMEFFKSYRNNKLGTFLDVTAVDKDLNLRHYVEVEPGFYDLIKMNKDGSIEYSEHINGLDTSEFHEDYHIDHSYNKISDKHDYVIYKIKGSNILFKQTGANKNSFYSVPTLLSAYAVGDKLPGKYNYPVVNNELVSLLRQQLDALNEHTALTKDMLDTANIRSNALSEIKKHTDALWAKQGVDSHIPF